MIVGTGVLLIFYQAHEVLVHAAFLTTPRAAPHVEISEVEPGAARMSFGDLCRIAEETVPGSRVTGYLVWWMRPGRRT